MFTEIFVRLLQQKEITPYRIAKETGISQGLMNEYKLGKKLPTLQNIQKIADYLDCSVDYLLASTKHNFTNATKIRIFSENAWHSLYPHICTFSIYRIIFPHFVHFFRICPHVLSTRFHMWTYVITHKLRICFLYNHTNIRK